MSKHRRRILDPISLLREYTISKKPIQVAKGYMYFGSHRISLKKKTGT